MMRKDWVIIQLLMGILCLTLAKNTCNAVNVDNQKIYNMDSLESINDRKYPFLNSLIECVKHREYIYCRIKNSDLTEFFFGEAEMRRMCIKFEKTLFSKNEKFLGKSKGICVEKESKK